MHPGVACFARIVENMLPIAYSVKQVAADPQFNLLSNQGAGHV
jgi:hypothetical protein